VPSYRAVDYSTGKFERGRAEEQRERKERAMGVRV
jgi:hypothetical protein